MFFRSLCDIRWQRASQRWRNRAQSGRHISAVTESQPSISLPSHAQVVICGGGIMGTSVAYHLSKLGWKDILLLEQGRLAAGSTRFCAGIVSSARHFTLNQKMADYSNKLYQQLEQETGIQTGYIRTGSILLAQTQDRLISLKRINSRLSVMGIPSEIISPKRVAELYPLISIHDLVGAMHVPEDAVVSPADVTLALASAASQNGVQIRDRTSVVHVMVKKGHVTGVETDRGDVECQYFVNCAGQWAYELGLSNEEPVNIPLHACEHFYLLTRPLETPLLSTTPTIVDSDGRIYIRNWQGGILSGGFEKNPKPIFTEGKNQLDIQNLHEDWDHFEPLLSSLLRRMPALETLEIMKLVNCPETFTPDMRCIMGESPNVQGYFVLAGMNSAGTSFAGGAGKYLAEWIVHGYPSENVWSLDLKRFGALQSSRTFLRHRVMEVMPLLCDLKVPRWDFQTGRQLRTSPLYDRLDAQGARWMEKHGFERPKYFIPHGKDLLALEQSKTFYKPDWFDIVESEVKCCKEAVCVIDMSSFTKFEIMSPGAQDFELLQYLFSNDLDVPVGHIVHTGMLNEGGGYENDCSIARLSKSSFFMISPTDQQVHCWAWLKKHMPENSSLFLEDVTWKYTALNLIGPRAMDVLSELSYAPMTPDHFPSLFCKEMSVGYANGIRVMSMTHTGEPGFMLYIPIEYALHVYNELMSVGQKYGIRNAGYYALRSLRIEKFFAFWGQDLNPFTTPLECGREFRVKLDKGMDFIGRDALLQQRQNGVYKRFTMFILEDHDTDLDLWPWWGEPIYRNGQYVGVTTSSAYSFTLERHICLGFVHNFNQETGEKLVVTPDFINRGEYEIDIAGQRFQAKAKLYPFSSLFTYKRRKDEIEMSDLQGK
ncbi:pyruvate dehydrogenase phosphatase regulatory subunit, mitochondrial isoform X1 [Dromiciops gliroides]|uniref:pyruvate dehydrogenase phosphatase regulatory subunit, mitochondrial isoform X1 n=1 Tax=Dromiciops gliroides TaxID=33562 RepID=UPI001CC4B9D2|nr:pyruvate dehydrogenase phosphatase regulatory subunit, mitochondrial isoform X1 [Dromiciops gliroides]XP_043839143.1 pyruvate dehydrogenase phosphatase regulatory subunit, mitochondrial isoform X1 [Dromiciops gliroides]XP_043839144.1 pyruvate dehydrogenase phosphatase regulatory subunit, mitochondrial isoform X1 [Dromiciops gliroides]XP_043839145.1 pyruvate dehydrogenase phosphatase regulatory subunit, mitochondrial isoform X1 [Dromiciops gliroides]XP_043839146.1 pyruvate dehydrogenase phosp